MGSNDELLSIVSQLRRENSRLKLDLIRYQLIAVKYENYFKNLQNNTLFTINFDDKFVKQIDALKDTKSCFIQMTDYSKGFNSSVGHESSSQKVVEIDINCNTSDESEDIDESQESEALNETSDEKSQKHIDLEIISDNNRRTSSRKRKHKSIESDDKDLESDEHNSRSSDKRPPFAVTAEINTNSDSNDEEIDENHEPVSYQRRLGSKYRCDCEDGCDYETANQSLLRQHQLSTHSKGPLFKCSLNDCDKDFKAQRNLKDHQMAVHPLSFPEIPWIRCKHTDCPFQTKSRNTYHKHRKSHKNPDYKYKPNIKPKCKERLKEFAINPLIGFQTQSELVPEPVAEVVVDRRCGWPSCDQQFATEEDMVSHMISHTNSDHKWEQVLDLSELMPDFKQLAV